ncbi:MAG: hypothetical protein ACE5K0_10240 [Candidatus Methanofastidiosia archaeon]
MKISEIQDRLEKAKETLREYGYICDVSVKDLIGYLSADTYDETLSIDDILKKHLLVIHELVEIDEIKEMGLRITKDVIIKNYERIYKAHLKAVEVELEIAKDIGEFKHIEEKIGWIISWLEDPRLPPELRYKCERIYRKAEQAVAE